MPENDKYVINAEYTGISLAYINTDYIADKVLPRMSVKNKEFSYDKYPADAFVSVPKTLIGSKGIPETVDIQKERLTDSVEFHALIDSVAQSDIDEQSEGEDLMGDNVLLLTESIALAREVRTAQLLSNPANYGSNKVTLSGTNKFSNKSSSFLDTYFEARANMLIKPNKMVLSDDGALYLRRHPDVVSMYKANYSDSQSGIAPLAYLAELLQLDEIFVGKAIKNSANKGQTATLVSVWGNDVILMYQNPLAKPKQGLTFGYTAEWQTRNVGQFFDPKPGYKGVWENKVAEAVKEILSASESCGYLIQSAF